MEMVIKFYHWILELIFVLTFATLGSVCLCTHPLIMCLCLVLLSLIISAMTGILLNKWFMYALILIFLGGMMIVFIYATTLSNNEKITSTFPISPLVIPSLLFVSAPPTLSTVAVSPQFSTSPMAQIFTPSTVPIMAFLMVFLLGVLFITIKLSENFKGALVKFS